MLDKLREMMEEAQSHAQRYDELSATLVKLGRKRDTSLFALLGLVRDIALLVKQLKPSDQRKLLGKDYNMFGGLKENVDKTLRKSAPKLKVKTRAKYAPVVRLLIAKMPTGGNVKAFVRENGGINGCGKKEQDLRKRGNQKSRKH